MEPLIQRIPVWWSTSSCRSRADLDSEETKLINANIRIPEFYGLFSRGCGRTKPVVQKTGGWYKLSQGDLKLISLRSGPHSSGSNVQADPLLLIVLATLVLFKSGSGWLPNSCQGKPELSNPVKHIILHTCWGQKNRWKDFVSWTV